jgi:hypothetical protein
MADVVLNPKTSALLLQDRDVMVSICGCRSMRQRCARASSALGLRVGFHAPHAPNLHRCTVESPFR